MPLHELNNGNFLCGYNTKLIYFTKTYNDYFDNKINIENNNEINMITEIKNNIVAVAYIGISCINFFDLQTKQLIANLDLNYLPEISDFTMLSKNVLSVVGKNLLFIDINEFKVIKQISTEYYFSNIHKYNDYTIIVSGEKQKDNNSSISSNDEEEEKSLRFFQFEEEEIYKENKKINGIWRIKSFKDFKNNEYNFFRIFKDTLIYANEQGEISIFKNE